VIGEGLTDDRQHPSLGRLVGSGFHVMSAVFAVVVAIVVSFSKFRAASQYSRVGDSFDIIKIGHDLISTKLIKRGSICGRLNSITNGWCCNYFIIIEIDPTSTDLLSIHIRQIIIL
jgi:hypothetical protein